MTEPIAARSSYTTKQWIALVTGSEYACAARVWLSAVYVCKLRPEKLVLGASGHVCVGARIKRGSRRDLMTSGLCLSAMMDNIEENNSAANEQAGQVCGHDEKPSEYSLGFLCILAGLPSRRPAFIHG